MSTKIQVITVTIAALGLSLIIASGSLGSALALSDQERYDVGHHEGALQAAHDKVYGGYYNTDCQRYDNSITHTDAYCQGYLAGYVYNWHALRNDITIRTDQSISQRSTINCFIAICNNHVNQRASQENSVNSGN